MPKDTVRWRQQHDKNPRDGHGCVSTDGAMNGGTQHHDLIATASHWDLEQDYEQRPRKKRKHDEEDTRLPIITAEGRLERSHLPDLKDESGDSYVESDEDADGQTEEDALEDVPDNPVGSTREQIVEAKEELARIAGLLNEDPEENAALLRKLSQLGASKIVTIKKLALATQLAVYRDVIPGYRIRPTAEADAQAKLSKEVRRLRTFEQSLVAGYQDHVRELARLAKAGKEHSGETAASLATVAISCACTLLTSVPHFNFRGELLQILVNKLSGRKIDADFVKCRHTLETLFQTDEDGAPSLDGTAMLTKMMKARGYRVHESVLNIFLHLRLLSEFSSKGSQTNIDRVDDQNEVSRNKVREKREFRTKKQRKLYKEKRVVEKEMREADAAVSHEERGRMQAEMLKLVFVTYFRILKTRTPSLMGAVLEGLAKYAHLINQDFFGDLLEALKDLIRHAEAANDEEGGETPEEADASASRSATREALLCIITAFALLQGQSTNSATATLNLDLNFFTTHLYRTLYPLSLNPDLELNAKSLHLPDPNAPSATVQNKINVQTTTVLLLRCLSSVLLPPQGVRGVPPLRIAAFSKQLMTVALQLPEKSCLAAIGLLQKVAKIHGRKMAGLWRTEERRGDGVFDGLHAEVEGSNPFASTVWEGELLRLHYCPAVRDGVKILESIMADVK